MPMLPRGGSALAYRHMKLWSSSSADGTLNDVTEQPCGLTPAHHVLDGAVLARRVHGLEHQQQRVAVVGVEQFLRLRQLRPVVRQHRVGRAPCASFLSMSRISAGSQARVVVGDPESLLRIDAQLFQGLASHAHAVLRCSGWRGRAGPAFLDQHRSTVVPGAGPLAQSRTGATAQNTSDVDQADAHDHDRVGDPGGPVQHAHRAQLALVGQVAPDQRHQHPAGRQRDERVVGPLDRHRVVHRRQRTGRRCPSMTAPVRMPVTPNEIRLVASLYGSHSAM